MSITAKTVAITRNKPTTKNNNNNKNETKTKQKRNKNETKKNSEVARSN